MRARCPVCRKVLEFRRSNKGGGWIEEKRDPPFHLLSPSGKKILCPRVFGL